MLDPDVVLRSDGGAKRPVASAVVRGAENVASRAMTFAMPRTVLRPVRVNGEAGVVVVSNRRVLSVMGFTVPKAGSSRSRRSPIPNGSPSSTSQRSTSARRTAALASSRVESRVGSEELLSSMIRGISVHPRMTASHPSPRIRSMTA